MISNVFLVTLFGEVQVLSAYWVGELSWEASPVPNPALLILLDWRVAAERFMQTSTHGTFQMCSKSFHVRHCRGFQNVRDETNGQKFC